ncbi:hypothetical protein BT69DRAFT_1279825 [Atractiella rhizophila]|nr:hypothetical protein BT69DRAFT_1279825 [Atractiella rhizophila]
MATQDSDNASRIQSLQESTSNLFSKIIPRFAVSSLPRSVEWYKKAGFVIHFQSSTHASVSRGPKSACGIFLYVHELTRGDKEKLETGEVMVMIDGDWDGEQGGDNSVDLVEELLEKSGIDITERVETRPWGFRQFLVTDPDGNRLIFFEHLKANADQ